MLTNKEQLYNQSSSKNLKPEKSSRINLTPPPPPPLINIIWMPYIVSSRPRYPWDTWSERQGSSEPDGRLWVRRSKPCFVSGFRSFLPLQILTRRTNRSTGISPTYRDLMKRDNNSAVSESSGKLSVLNTGYKYIILCYTTSHHIILYYIILYYIILYYIILYYIILYYIILYYIILYYIILYYIILYYIILYYITLHCIALHYITLHYITLYYITLHYPGVFKFRCKGG